MVSDIHGGQSSVRRLGTSPFQTPNLTCPDLFIQVGAFMYYISDSAVHGLAKIPVTEVVGDTDIINDELLDVPNDAVP